MVGRSGAGERNYLELAQALEEKSGGVSFSPFVSSHPEGFFFFSFFLFIYLFFQEFIYYIFLRIYLLYLLYCLFCLFVQSRFFLLQTHFAARMQK